MRVLVLGTGAKDHALAWWLRRSSFISALYMAPGTPGASDIAVNLSDVDPADRKAVYEAVKAHDIDAVFIGTEAPLLAGVREYLSEKGIFCFGATSEALRLEDDKAYARAFNQRNGIPTPDNALFLDRESLAAYLDENAGKRYTIKSNAMAPSRVMMNSNSKEELMAYADILFSRGPVLLEDYISGKHVTATVLMDRKGFLLMPFANEYTHMAHENMTPTGGMGAIAPVPLRDDVQEEIQKKIITPTLDGMKREGINYRGVLTLSIVIKEEDDQPCLVDYHVRLNDPATQAMVTIIKSDLGEMLYAMREDKLSTMKMETTSDCAVAVVLASYGYPLQPEVGKEVKGLSNAFLQTLSGKPVVFLGAIKKTVDGRYLTDGGRVLTVVGTGANIQEANEKAYALIKGKRFENLWYRDDIGNKFFSS